MAPEPPPSDHPARGGREHEDLRQQVAALRDHAIALWRQADALDAAGWDSRAIHREVEEAYAQYLDRYLALLALDASGADGPRHE